MTLLDRISGISRIISHKPVGILAGVMWKGEFSPSLATVGLVWPYLPPWANMHDPDRRFFPEREMVITHYEHKYDRECVRRLTLGDDVPSIKHVEPYAAVISGSALKVLMAQNSQFFERVHEVQQQIY